MRWKNYGLLLTSVVFLGAAWAGPAQLDQSDKFADFQAGAIMVPLPDIQQPEEYSCGAAALMAILAYYGVGPEDYDVLKKRLGTNRKDGTDYNMIRDYAQEVGLTVNVRTGMKPEELDTCLRKRRPVICSIQAYEDKHLDQIPKIYYEKNVNGHFVVAIGFDDKNYYFMDPSCTGRRAFLPREEFVKRWHDNEGRANRPNIIERLGLEIWSDQLKPAYDRRARRID